MLVLTPAERNLVTDDDRADALKIAVHKTTPPS
jgi:hypothetical protein